MRIEDIKQRFCSQEAYRVYSACMYMPTFEKLEAEARKFLTDDSISIFGYLDDDEILGIIAVGKTGAYAEIIGIAVAQENRGKGIGKSLIDFSADRFGVLFAETDDDAVGFYINCDFEIERFVKEFPNGKCVRYNCTLK